MCFTLKLHQFERRRRVESVSVRGTDPPQSGNGFSETDLDPDWWCEPSLIQLCDAATMNEEAETRHQHFTLFVDKLYYHEAQTTAGKI